MNTIRLLAIIEAASLTGPAKNLLDFCARTRTVESVRIEPHLVTFRRGGIDSQDTFLEAARAADIPVEIVSERGRLDRTVIESLTRITERMDPGILQTHAVKSHFLLRNSGLWKKRPWIAFHHGYTSTDAKMLAYNLLDLWSLRAPSRIVTVSEAFERQLTSRGIARERITVLHNAVDPAWIEHRGFSRESGRQLLGISPEARIILAVGRLSREKAFGDLLSAMAQLKSKHPQPTPHLYIAGDGPDLASLEASASALGIASSVTFTGSINDLAPYYAAADILVISSEKEGSPNALLEAMAARLPVVATRVGGIPEIVTDNETALLVPAHNPDALANAIARTLNEPETARRMAERAHQTIVARFDPQARAQKLADIYAAIYAEVMRGASARAS